MMQTRIVALRGVAEMILGRRVKLVVLLWHNGGCNNNTHTH